MDKQLQNKAIDIKGKKYVQVKDRINYFNETYPNGEIHTELLSDNNEGVVVVRASVFPHDMINGNGTRFFTGISASNPSKMLEKGSPYEVAETSAVGRALAFMGIGVIDSVASVDEMSKSGAYRSTQSLAEKDETTATCPIHNVEMEQKEGSYGTFWSHLLPNGSYCNGRQTKYNGGK
jgi:hypothetical protein